MVKGIVYNHRTNQIGVELFDTCFIGEEMYYCGNEYMVDSIVVDGMAATILCHTVDEKEQADKYYTIVQTNIHSYINQLDGGDPDNQENSQG